MKTVAQILEAKPDRTVYTIAPTASVFDALTLMSQRNLGALMVMENDQILGIVSERDYARKVVLLGRISKETLVREIMTAPVKCVAPERSNEECMALMTEHRIRHLPVVAEGKLVGIVSIGDLVKDTISEQKFMIEQLQHYIMGDRG